MQMMLTSYENWLWTLPMLQIIMLKAR